MFLPMTPQRTDFVYFIYNMITIITINKPQQPSLHLSPHPVVQKVPLHLPYTGLFSR